MKGTISKSQFKPRALELMREVENTGKELTITDRGRPVLKIVPYSQKPSEILRNLRGTVLKYDAPTEPVDIDWSAIK